MTDSYSTTYDAWNRLVEVKDGSNVVLKCEYDGLGRRTKKFVNTSDPLDQTYDAYRHFFYSASWQILETRRSDSENDPPESENPEVQYVWSRRYIDAPVLRDRDAGAGGDLGVTDSGLDERLYYTTDANMNVTALLDTGGDAVERYSCDPYGNCTVYDDDWSDEVSWANSKQNHIRYCGYYFDNETGLCHVRHRVLHPSLGRWLQRDPVGYRDSYNLYVYVRCAPAVLVDPLGLSGADELLGIEDMRCQGGQFKVMWPLGNFTPIPTPIPLVKLEVAFGAGIVVKGTTCCVVCPNGERGYKAKGSLKGRVEARFGVTAGINESTWLYTVFFGVRAYVGVRGELGGTVKYNSCTDKLAFGLEASVSGFGGVEGGAKFGVLGARAEVMLGGRATITTGVSLDCDWDTCNGNLGKTDLVFQLYIRAGAGAERGPRAGGKRLGEKRFPLAGGMPFSFSSPPAVARGMADGLKALMN